MGLWRKNKASNVRISGSGNIVVVNGQVSKGENNTDGKIIEEQKIDIGCTAFDSVSADISVGDIVIERAPSECDSHVRIYNGVEDGVQVEISKGILRVFEDSSSSECPRVVISLPDESYELIEAKSIAGNIVIENLNIEKVVLSSTSGDIRTRKIHATEYQVKTTSGDIELSDEVTEPTNINLKSTSGDITVRFDGISIVDVSTKTMSGDVDKYLHREGGGAVLSGKASTMSGDITIR